MIFPLNISLDGYRTLGFKVLSFIHKKFYIQPNYYSKVRSQNTSKDLPHKNLIKNISEGGNQIRREVNPGDVIKI